ncbi:MAG: hypothetical protein ACLGQH_12340 [Acidobacteriota bacterium]
MLELNEYTVEAIAGVALFFFIAGFLTQKKNKKIVHRLNWNKEIISWSSGVMEEIGSVLYIFEQLKYGASFEDVSDDVIVSKQNMSALLDFGRLLIGNVRQGKKRLDENWKYAEQKQRALESIHAVHGRLCLIASASGNVDVDENIMYISQCRKSFATDIQFEIEYLPGEHKGA